MAFGKQELRLFHVARTCTGRKNFFEPFDAASVLLCFEKLFGVFVALFAPIGVGHFFVRRSGRTTHHGCHIKEKRNEQGTLENFFHFFSLVNSNFHAVK